MKKVRFNLALILSLATILVSLTACNQDKKNAATGDLPPGTHAVSVIDVIQTSNYTYLQVFENDQKFWIAITRAEAKAGDVLYFTNAMEMKDFKSKELNRTFPSILFVNDPSSTPPSEKKVEKSSGKITAKRLTEISVEPAKGGITISELFKNKSQYAEKTVKISGVVVKYNFNIMKKNWVHIQDGTESGGSYDLTVTTMDALEEGNVVTFEGVIRLDKDFGAGYAYDVIMEDAKAIEVKKTGDANM